jgi:ribosomal protein S12 methylthiotransferase
MSPDRPQVGFVSLGCPKALVDSERILTRLRAEGYEISGSYQDSDVVIVNTCGFIESAVAESLDAIGEAMAENGRVVVTGCLGARSAEIRERFPDLLSISGPQAFDTVMHAIHKAAPPPEDPFVSLIPPGGIKLTPRHYAYLKIAEGCNHKCSFASSPACAAAWSAAPSMTCSPRARSWLRRVFVNC